MSTPRRLINSLFGKITSGHSANQSSCTANEETAEEHDSNLECYYAGETIKVGIGDPTFYKAWEKQGDPDYRNNSIIDNSDNTWKACGRFRFYHSHNCPWCGNKKSVMRLVGDGMTTCDQCGQLFKVNYDERDVERALDFFDKTIDDGTVEL